jgi:cell division protein FtsL
MENSSSEYDPQPEKKNNNKLFMILIIISLLANAGLAYLFFQERQTVSILTGENSEITAEKNSIEAELQNMLVQYDSLTTDNDSLMAEVAMEKEKIAELMDKVKQSNWTIYKLKKETESLRSVMKDFVHTIDSLNTANQMLMAENEQIRGELGKERSKSQELSEKNKDLSKKVAIGEQLVSLSTEATALRLKGSGASKETDKSNKTDKIKCCITLGANELTKAGTKKVYLRIVAPSGKVLTTAANRTAMFEFDGVRGLYSAMKEVNYENQDLDVCLFWEKDNDLLPGKYDVFAYCEDYEVGKTSFTLR